MGTRVRVGIVGQSTGFNLIRVDLEAREDAIRVELLSKAAEKLAVSKPADLSIADASRFLF